jgi:hypothetical protein
MRSIGRGIVKAELFLIAITALCLVGAVIALVVQYARAGEHHGGRQRAGGARQPSAAAGPRTFQP